MKRSEMIALLVEFMDQDKFYVDVSEAADALLKFIEEQGMLPPAHTDVNRGDHMDFYEINEWEKEA